MQFTCPKRWVHLTAFCGAMSLPITAHAGHYECNHRPVAKSTQQCPDGSIPMYLADPMRSEQPRQPEMPAQPNSFPDPPMQLNQVSGNPSSLFGLWETNVSSATWTGPSDRWGYAVQHSSAGALSGGLLIRNNRTFRWNSAYCTHNAGWSKTGDPGRPIVLHCINDGRPKDWSAALDTRHPGHIHIWDEWGVSYNGKFVH